MFLKPQDLALPRHQGQVVPLAGGFGVLGRGEWRRQEAIGRRRGYVASPKLSGMGQVANPRAAEALVLIQKIMATKQLADIAKKLADQAVSRAATKAKMSGLGRWRWPWEWVADEVVTPVAEWVGNDTYAYIPKEEDIAAAEANVERLKSNIKAREKAHAAAVDSGNDAHIAANPPVPESTRTAAKLGEQNVKDMKDAREKILDPFGELGKIWRKAKWYVAGGGAIMVCAVACGLYSRAKGRG